MKIKATIEIPPGKYCNIVNIQAIFGQWCDFVTYPPFRCSIYDKNLIQKDGIIFKCKECEQAKEVK